jgi:hypothetical protein
MHAQLSRAQVQIGGERYNLFMECPHAKTCTIILRGGAEQFIDETERSLHDSIMVVRRALKNDTVVAGGGAIEVQYGMVPPGWDRIGMHAARPGAGRGVAFVVDNMGVSCAACRADGAQPIPAGAREDNSGQAAASVGGVCQGARGDPAAAMRECRV